MDTEAAETSRHSLSASCFDTDIRNIVSEEHNTESSTMTDDYSIVCDELLEELETDLEIFSPKTVQTK